MFRWLQSLFAWRLSHVAGAWAYSENAVTGQRSARQVIVGGYSPINFDWLDGGRGHPIVNGVPAWRSAQGQSNDPYFN